MEYIVVEVMEDSIFVVDSVPIEYIIFPKPIFDTIPKELLSLVNIKNYDNIHSLFYDIKNKLVWMTNEDISDIIRNRILWDYKNIDIIRIF